MDKPTEGEVNAQKRKKLVLISMLLIAGLIGAICLLRFSFRWSLPISGIITAVVEKGDIENTLNASGEILPEFKQIITIPSNASIQKVLLDAGNRVK